MFINCRHCHALVATDPATDLPPERCPRCRGVLRRPDAATAPGPGPAAAPALAPAAAAPAPLRDARAPAPDDAAAGMSASREAPSAPAAPSPGDAAGAAPRADAAAVRQPATPAADERRPDLPPGHQAAAPGPAPAASNTADAGDAPGSAVAPQDGDDAVARTGDDDADRDGTRDGDRDGADDRDADATTAPRKTPDPDTTRTTADADTEHASARDEPSPPSSAEADPGFASGRVAPAPRAATPRPRAWGTAAIAAALVLLLALQIVLADRERLAADPEWRPLVAGACGLLGCELPPWREPSAIVLVSREVRPHPSRAQALQVRASFRNEARWPQAWPRMLLTLSDVDGRTVAARAFEPHEYLGAPPAARFAPGQTADIALDIHEPSAATVSYAFDFHP